MLIVKNWATWWGKKKSCSSIILSFTLVTGLKITSWMYFVATKICKVVEHRTILWKKLFLNLGKRYLIVYLFLLRILEDEYFV